MSLEINQVMQQLGADAGQFERAVARLASSRRRYERLWAYYANPMRLATNATGRSERPYRQAQEWGIPRRITGYLPGIDPLLDGPAAPEERKDVVVENDIAWRVDTMVDYLVGRLPRFRASAAEPERREQIERLLGAMLEHNGGVRLLQQIAVMGAVYGYVDIAVTLDTAAAAALQENVKRASGTTACANTGDTSLEGEAAPACPQDMPERDEPMLEIARLVSLQVVEPARTIVLTHPEDATRTLSYAQVYDVAVQGAGGMAEAIRGFFRGERREKARIVELWSDTGWWRWRDEQCEAAGGNSLGRIPVVHVQSTAVPFAYSGGSDVEALIPLQDELNTRLSDRAHRIAMQSFRMYLGKGIDITKDLPHPGRVWSGSADAEIQELGGEADCAAEQQHIAEVREALDKVSGVPPVAAGAIRNRIGNLTSAAALRVTLMSLLSRTERKQALYGEGLRRVCELALHWLGVAGVFATTPRERQVEISFANPLPENAAERLEEAKLKLEVGVGKEVVLREMGY